MEDQIESTAGHANTFLLNPGWGLIHFICLCLCEAHRIFSAMSYVIRRIRLNINLLPFIRHPPLLRWPVPSRLGLKEASSPYNLASHRRTDGDPRRWPCRTPGKGLCMSLMIVQRKKTCIYYSSKRCAFHGKILDSKIA